MKQISTGEWFEEWFDTEYYHQLYQHRDTVEAKQFLSLITEKLNMQKGEHVLDLCCGKGRHAHFLASLGFEVTGIDLSHQNIEQASLSASGSEHFIRQDMRTPFGDGVYDVVFNMFTSFGYFENTEDDKLVLEHIYAALKPGGYFVFDFLNPNYVKENLEPRCESQIGMTQFESIRTIEGDRVFKKIFVKANCEIYPYVESVRLYEPTALLQMFGDIGFYEMNHFGSYQLSDYHENAKRSIFVLQKKIT